MDEIFKKLNEQFGNDPNFQRILREYLKYKILKQVQNDSKKKEDFKQWLKNRN